MLRDGKVGAANTLAASAGTNNTEESILDVVEDVRGNIEKPSIAFDPPGRDCFQ